MDLANQQRRKRSQNWESSDKILLRQLVTAHINVLENKNVDTNTSRQKRDAWKQILESYQASSTTRSVAQIQCHRREINATGGGPPPQSPNREDIDLLALISEEFETDCNIYDCDEAVENVEYLNEDIEESVCESIAENVDGDDTDVAPTQQKRSRPKKRKMTSEQMKAELFELAVSNKKEKHEKRMEILKMEMVHKIAENAQREKEHLLRIKNLQRTGNFGEPSRLRRRKIYKKRVDCFKLPDCEFWKKYRFTKSSVRYIISLVEDDIQLDKRGSGTSPQLQVLVALQCWGRREVQDDTGDLHGLSQPTVSRICTRVARSLARLANTFIKMPSTLTEEETAMREFRKIQNFPGIIGAIDGTHVRIRKTGGEEAQYYINRKGFYSLNIQTVCDAQLKIKDLVARWRGSTHDSRIFNESSLKQRFESGEFRGRLIGDSGYELLPYLFTPLSSPQTDKEKKYNKAHIATRNTVERCFGVWKQRFRCLLHGLPVNLENAKVVIVALAVLHNIAIDMDDKIIDGDDDDTIIEGHELILCENEPTRSGQTRGINNRPNFILRHFIETNF